MIRDEQLLPATAVADEPLAEVDLKSISGETEDLTALRMAQAATLKAEADDLDFVEAWVRLGEEHHPSGRSARYQEAKKLHDQTFHDARELFVQQSLNPEAPEAGLLAIKEAEATQAQEQASEMFDLNVYADSLAVDLPEEEKKALAARLIMMDKLTELTQDISGWELTRDIALEVVISPKALWDNMQAFGSLNPFQAQETFQRFATWFQELSPEEQLQYYPAIQEYIVNAMPRHRAAVFLQGLIDPALMADGEGDLGFWGTVDAAAIGVGVAGAALKLRKLYNPIRAAAKAGKTEQAAGANLAIMQGIDNGVGEMIGVDRITAQTNALPFHGEAIDSSVADELSPAVHERIFQFRDRLKEAFGNLADAKTFVREGFLDDQDKTKAINRLNDEFARYVSSTFQGQDKIVKLDSTKVTSEGVEFSFEVTDSAGNVVKDTYKGLFTTDDIGFWQSLPKKSAFLSEKAQSYKTDFMSAVNAAIRLDNTAATVATQLRKVIKDASKPIKGFKGKPRKQRVKEVDQVLLAGDDMGKEFTPAELKAGVNGIKLDEDQIEYYYNMRGVMNGLGILRNMEVRRTMQARGVKTVTVDPENRFFGEVVDDAANASRRLRDKVAIFRFGEEGGRRIDVNKLNMEEEYAKGYRLVRLEEDTFFGGNRYQHVLVKSDTVSDLPWVVLDLKKGYIPRVNPKATYFVQAFTPSSVDGVQSVLRKAVRSFDNKAEADKFASQMYARAQEEGFGPKTEFRVVEDGELEAFRAGDSGMTQTGGLIYGKRARTKIPHNDGDAASVPRTSALEAIELYLENTKNFMTRNEWRMGMRKKWEKTAEFHLGTRVSFDDPGAALANTDLRVAWEKINDFSGFMDKSERAWEQFVKGVYEWSIEKAGRNRISDFILTQRHKDPLARLRSATFHTLLGFFNPIQLWVQAQGAAVALSINLTNPARAAKVFQRQHGLTMLQHVNFDDSKDITSKLAKAFGFDDVEEMRATKQLWDKSGYYDSTLSSADVEAAARGFPTTGDALKKFIDSGLMFFRTGELFNRRFAFLTAVDELGGAKKVLADDQLLKEAMNRTNNLLLNLGKANRASWQKGFLSIPTQFMQIQSKTIETILGMNGALTGPERMKLLMGQFALYGAAGMFGGQWALRQIAAMSGKDQIDINNMDEGHLRAFTGGLTDWMLYQLGADVIGSDRGALLNGMDQTLFSLFTEEMTAFEWLAGPSSVGPERLWRKLRQVSAWFATPQDINGEVSFEAQDVTDTLKFLADGARGVALSPFATGRQIDMFFLMRDLGQLRDQNGNLIAAPRGGFDWQTEWAALMGFKPELLQRKYDLSTINEELRKTVEFRTTILLEAWDSFLMNLERARSEGRELTDDEIRLHRKRRNVLINSIPDPGVRQQVLESFRNRLTERRTGNSQLDRQMQRYYDNMVLDIANEFTDSTRLIQTREQ